MASTRDEERQGVRGKSWVFASADGKTRYRLLLLAADGRVVGLYAQGDAVAVEKSQATLDEMWSSLTIERPQDYPVRSWRDFETTLGVPASWTQTREFSGGGTRLIQYASPPLAVEHGNQTVHASLSVTLEAVKDGGGLREYYDATRVKLGENFQVSSHQGFGGGYVDVMRTETPVAVTYIKRFYFANAGHGCSLSFEAREDVFSRVSRWADYIASTVQLAPSQGAPAVLPTVDVIAPAVAPSASPSPARREGGPLNATLARIGHGLGRLLHGPDVVEAVVTTEGPSGELAVPSGHDGVWETTTVQGRACLRPVESSYYLYFVLPPAVRRRAAAPIWVEVEYFGAHYGEFRVQYASTDRGEPWDGVYKMAEQRWQPEAAGLRRFRRAMFALPDFDPARTQNLGASFRLEFRKELLVTSVRAHLVPPPDLDAFPAVAPLPDLRKMPGRFYPIDYLFIEITNACNFKCTWCPDEIMDRRRGFMKKERVFRILDEIAEKRPFLGPLFPVKLHQMGEPMLHPDLAAIVERAESRGVPIELNTNCGLITQERVDGALPGRPHEPDPVVPDAGPGDVQDPQGAEARLRRVPRQGPPRGRAEGRARGAHEPRDRHHEHEVRRRLPHRQRGRAGAWRSSPTGSRSPASSSSGTGSSRGRTTSRRSARRGSSTATRTAAATRSSTASTSSGSAATPGAT